MEDKNKVEINISGYSYTLVGKESTEYLQELAGYIDGRINKILASNNNLGIKDAGILTAFNVADELFKLRKEIQDKPTDEELALELEATKEENKKLKEENNELRKEALANVNDNNFKEELQQAYEQISTLLLERDKMLEELSKEKEKNTNLHFSLVELKSELVQNSSTLQ